MNHRARRGILIGVCAVWIGIISPLAAQTEVLRVPASRISDSRLDSLPFDLRRGIGPDEAAIVASYLNPALRSIRDRRGLAVAQLIQAGVLPNPQVSYTRDYVTGGNTAGTTNAFNFNASWEVTSLLPLLPKRTAARANLRSVDLDIAWNEWQIVESARLAVYRVIALRDELASATEADRELTQSAETLKRAVEAHEKTVIDYGAAEASSQDARATALGLAQEHNKQRLGLQRILGVSPDSEVRLRPGIELPSHLEVPSQEALTEGLENRRLDLLALQQGYRSQDANVRVAILEQFPKISLGFAKASDTTDVHTSGFAVTVDVPILNRNQGVLATERATRQKLLDEYNQRVFEAHSDIATALSDIRWLNRQVAAAEEALPIFERLVKSAETAMEEGHTDVLAYYTARSGLLQRRVQLVKLKELLLEAQTALEIASGRFIPSNKSVHLK